MKGALARSSLMTGGVLGLRVVTQAAVLVLLTRLLGPGLFGAFAAAASLAVVLGIIPSLGAGFIMLARAPQSPDAVVDVWRYAWPMTMGLGLLLLLVYVPAASMMGGALALPWPILLAIAASELLLMPGVALLSYVLQAHDRVPLSQLVQWLPLGLRIIAALLCFSAIDAERLQWYVVLQLLMALAGLVAGLRITRRHVVLRWRPRIASWEELKQGAVYASMHLVAANPSELDKIIAVRLVGGHDSGIYAATTRVMGALVTPVTAMLLAAQPRLFRHAHEPSAGGQRLIGVIAGLALGWGLLCWLLLVLSSPFLPWLFDDSFAAMTSLMPWIAIVAAPLSLRLAAGSVLMALGRPLERLGFELCGIAALVSGMFILAPAMGVKGIIIGLFASECCMALIGWWRVRHWLFQRVPSV